MFGALLTMPKTFIALEKTFTVYTAQDWITAIEDLYGIDYTLTWSAIDPTARLAWHIDGPYLGTFYHDQKYGRVNKWQIVETKAKKFRVKHYDTK